MVAVFYLFLDHVHFCSFPLLHTVYSLHVIPFWCCLCTHVFIHHVIVRPAIYKIMLQFLHIDVKNYNNLFFIVKCYMPHFFSIWNTKNTKDCNEIVKNILKGIVKTKTWTSCSIMNILCYQANLHRIYVYLHVSWSSTAKILALYIKDICVVP